VDLTLDLLKAFLFTIKASRGTYNSEELFYAAGCNASAAHLHGLVPGSCELQSLFVFATGGAPGSDVAVLWHNINERWTTCPPLYFFFLKK
jgi:hypothetical protein